MWTPQERRRLVAALAARDGGRKCVRCGMRLSLQKTTIDHKVAKSLGGTDDISNLQLMCLPCNNEKSKTESRMANRQMKIRHQTEQWMASIAKIPE